jgi:hypothetical protein
MMVRALNLTVEYGHWLQGQGSAVPSDRGERLEAFRTRVLATSPRHTWSAQLSEQACADSRASWLCIMIVSDPFDRVIASMVHVARTRLAAFWPELLAILPEKRRIERSAIAAAGNFSLWQHSQALELMLAHNAGRERGDQRWRAGHVLPQTPSWLGSAASALRVARAFKLVSAEDVADGLGAVDDAFRGGALGLRAIARDVLAADGLMMSNQRAAPLRQAARVDADTSVSKLCGHPSGFGDAGTGGRASCALPRSAYAKLRAANASLWAHVRCLYDEDVRLYTELTCKQRWLLSRCAACAATCSRSKASLDAIEHAAAVAVDEAWIAREMARGGIAATVASAVRGMSWGRVRVR